MSDPIVNSHAEMFRKLTNRPLPGWTAADDAALERQQVVERAAVEMVAGDQAQADAYLKLLTPDPAVRDLARKLAAATLRAALRRLSDG